MARVAVVVKIFPSEASLEPSTLAERVKKALPEGYEVVAEGEEPLAFGLRVLKMVISMPEETEGGTEGLEELIKGVDGVEDVEVESVSRIS